MNNLLLKFFSEIMLLTGVIWALLFFSLTIKTLYKWEAEGDKSLSSLIIYLMFFLMGLVMLIVSVLATIALELQK